jgi:hypothetical protein
MWNRARCRRSRRSFKHQRQRLCLQTGQSTVRRMAAASQPWRRRLRRTTCYRRTQAAARQTHSQACRPARAHRPEVRPCRAAWLSPRGVFICAARHGSFGAAMSFNTAETVPQAPARLRCITAILSQDSRRTANAARTASPP